MSETVTRLQQPLLSAETIVPGLTINRTTVKMIETDTRLQQPPLYAKTKAPAVVPALAQQLRDPELLEECLRLILKPIGLNDADSFPVAQPATGKDSLFDKEEGQREKEARCNQQDTEKANRPNNEESEQWTVQPTRARR